MSKTQEEACEYWEEPYSEDCSYCGGDGFVTSNDPLWDGWDEFGNPKLIDCPSCKGSGLAKDMTIW